MELSTDDINALYGLKEKPVFPGPGSTETNRPYDIGCERMWAANLMHADTRKTRRTEEAVKMLVAIVYGNQNEL